MKTVILNETRDSNEMKEIIESMETNNQLLTTFHCNNTSPVSKKTEQLFN